MAATRQPSRRLITTPCSSTTLAACSAIRPTKVCGDANRERSATRDDSRVVVAVGDLASAWDPKCAERGCDRRTVNKALRTFVFVRPNVLVIDDRIEVASDKDLVTWAAHMRAAPAISGLRAGVENGGSRADLTILAPAGVRLRAPKEPTSSETHVYRPQLATRRRLAS